jgi:hypothetical protein
LVAARHGYIKGFFDRQDLKYSEHPTGLGKQEVIAGYRSIQMEQHNMEVITSKTTKGLCTRPWRLNVFAELGGETTVQWCNKADALAVSIKAAW